jgi:hypothetical protein
MCFIGLAILIPSVVLAGFLAWSQWNDERVRREFLASIGMPWWP